MELSVISLWVTIVISPILALLFRRRNLKNSRQLPPGPPGWPVFGHLFKLGSAPHKTLAGLGQKYGPVVWLRLGSINTMVVLTAAAAAEFFKKHDASFAERTVTEVMRSHGFDRASLALAPYGTYWRVLKRLMTVEMLTHKRIAESVSVRRKCVDDMVSWIDRERENTTNNNNDGSERGVHVARFAFLASFNMLGNVVVSRDLFSPESREGSEFFTAMEGLMEWGGHPNVADLFPWMRFLDPQGLRRRMDRDLGKALAIAAAFVKERRTAGGAAGEKKKDFLGVLFEYEGNEKDEPDKISDHQLNIFILEVFLAGSETTSSTVEWAMVELLLNPDSMNRVKTELANVIGPNKKLEETDIDNLKYLQAVVKETLRLHPPIPFLVPRRAIHETEFMGYNIPENTQVFINAWAIGRDPTHWVDPMDFKPERFLDSGVDYKGQNFELIPFGAGRRICVGVPLAHRMLHLILGSLLNEFDWELERGVGGEGMDMRERMGVTVRKLEPLRAVPKKRNKI